MSEEDFEKAFTAFKTDNFVKSHFIASDVILKTMFKSLSLEEKKHWLEIAQTK